MTGKILSVFPYNGHPYRFGILELLEGEVIHETDKINVMRNCEVVHTGYLKLFHPNTNKPTTEFTPYRNENDFLHNQLGIICDIKLHSGDEIITV